MNSELRDPWCRTLTGQEVGKYKLEGFVGSGKIGYVYRAERSDFPAERAIKLVFDRLRRGWDVELRKVAQLELVDGVVHLHDLGAEMITRKGVSRLCQYTVWDYIAPGENLKSYLKRVGSIPTSFLLAVVERILHVLHACEAQGVSRHGDLHSGNILIGNPSPAKLDDMLQPRAPIYVSDFGYGTTGAIKMPKDDYQGLAQIINEMIECINYSTATAVDRQILAATRKSLNKLLREPARTERRPPLDLLRVLTEISRGVYAGDEGALHEGWLAVGGASRRAPAETPSVGHFQVAEMFGEQWEWWRRLFVPTIPARSKILRLDIPTVVTGPRGCGKTMLFRRLSERLIVECGEVADLPMNGRFVAFYINANDFADAFARFPERPTVEDEALLTCYANLCVLADLLEVQFARSRLPGGSPTSALLGHIRNLIVPDAYAALVEGEDQLGRYRTILEQIKWKFPSGSIQGLFSGYDELSKHRWLPRFLKQARQLCPWIGERSVLLFIDDFSTPRVSSSMQRVLNRLFLQRSPYFLAKLATEASSTFVPEDSSGKNLEDGDDYQLVDMGEESLFLPESERLAFLNDVFSPRLEADERIPEGSHLLRSLLGELGVPKTEFARRLRVSLAAQGPGERVPVASGSQRRGRSRGRVLYWGVDVFSNLWSGDTRTMIQLITDVVDQASEAGPRVKPGNQIKIPVPAALQDRVFRNRGGEWLNSHTGNEPTDPQRVKDELARLQTVNPAYALRGEYGDHLKAIVEAFVAAARRLLLGPTYRISEGRTLREVPRMAFRVEIVDDFRVDGLAREIYRDLVRYGLFIRDSRGKSVRGTFVPRLFLRRLLLPYATLALSKRDSVPLTCKEFISLLLEPDIFKASLTGHRVKKVQSGNQLKLSFLQVQSEEPPDSDYDDIGTRGQGDESPDDNGARDKRT